MTCTIQRRATWKTGAHSAVSARQTSTSGGCIETEQNEVAVNPHQRPVMSVVLTIVTPLGERGHRLTEQAGPLRGVGTGNHEMCAPSAGADGRTAPPNSWSIRVRLVVR